MMYLYPLVRLRFEELAEDWERIERLSDSILLLKSTELVQSSRSRDILEI